MGKMKMEFHGHDSIDEITAFAPTVAYPAIRKLAPPMRAHLVMVRAVLLTILQASDISKFGRWGLRLPYYCPVFPCWGFSVESVRWFSPAPSGASCYIRGKPC